MTKVRLRYHLLALFTVLVWGTTFTSTKVLILHSLTPAEILFYRFLIAYVVIWPFAPKPLFASKTADEIKLLALGLTGGSLYFLAENSALELTYTSNVALILCATPLITAIFTVMLFRDQHFSSKLLLGSLFAIAGVCCILINSSFVFRFSPAGDGLALLACLMWALYSVILKQLSDRYSILFITRKVFFYGLATMLPLSLLFPDCWHVAALTSPIVWVNLLFLGVVASCLCFFAWNKAIQQLGIITSNNYLYVQPFVALLCGALLLGEQITWIALLGGLLIIAGIYVAENGLKIGANHNN